MTSASVRVSVRSLAVLLARVEMLYLRLGAAPPQIEKATLKADADGLVAALVSLVESLPDEEAALVTAARHKVTNELWGTDSPQYKGGLLLEGLFQDEGPGEGDEEKES
jgi:hypothetical protein